MSRPSKWEQSARYWKTVPPASNVLLLAGIFFLFTSFGLVVGFTNRTWVYVPWAIAMAVISGAFSTVWAFAGFRRVIWLMAVLAPIQFGFFVLMGTLMRRYLPDFSQIEFSREAVLHRLMIEGVFGMFAIVIGYSLMAGFIRKEGMRIFVALAEVRLAAEVHQALVPRVSQRIGEFEFYGASVPSGQIGGDLVDLTEHGNEWTAYVADVSGHGVPAGMIMAMVKSAARMGSVNGNGLSGFLFDLNRVLLSVSAPNVFVTFACVTGSGDGNLRFALAGHLPILHYHKRLRTVEERVVSNLPLAIMADAQFDDAQIDCEHGDVLAILTDGLTEAADLSGLELGMEPLKEVLLQAAANPLEEIGSELRNRALARGKQVDDQTILLVRRTDAA
ncbi:MAG TPA: PP2C family protein-serine/threonine phosphatase [Candidatus Angelobacter sp.]|nr:PP2C family protein-serine/threonine phosphatase [Candidatus Angelobacter sp.]